MSAVPIMTIMMAHFLRGNEKINAGKIAALVLGGTGVVVLIGPNALAGVGQDLLGQLAILGATWCYAVNGLTARQLARLSPEAVTLGMLLTAAIVAVPLSLLLDRPWQMQASPLSLLAIAMLGVVPTSIGYLIAVRIIASAGAGFASLNNYLVPLFGVGWGILLLGEELQPRAVLALMLIFVGVTAPARVSGAARSDRATACFWKFADETRSYSFFNEGTVPIGWPPTERTPSAAVIATSSFDLVPLPARSDEPLGDLSDVFGEIERHNPTVFERLQPFLKPVRGQGEVAGRPQLRIETAIAGEGERQSVPF